MVNKAKLIEWTASLSESLNEQQWYQQIRGKWDELDPQSKTYLKFGGVGLVLLSILIFTFVEIWSVYSQRSELDEKIALLNSIQNANDEIRNIKTSIPSNALSNTSKKSDEENTSWMPYFESLAANVGIEKSNISLVSEKNGQSTDYSKETLFELSLKNINIKQVVKLILSLEGGQRPVKLRNLLINTKEDLSGYLDATLAVSTFTQTPTLQN